MSRAEVLSNTDLTRAIVSQASRPVTLLQTSRSIRHADPCTEYFEMWHATGCPQHASGAEVECLNAIGGLDGRLLPWNVRRGATHGSERSVGGAQRDTLPRGAEERHGAHCVGHGADRCRAIAVHSQNAPKTWSKHQLAARQSRGIRGEGRTSVSKPRRADATRTQHRQHA